MGTSTIPYDLLSLPPLLLKRRAAEVACTSVRTIDRLIASGVLQATRPTKAGSGRVLVLRDSLLQWLGLRKTEAT